MLDVKEAAEFLGLNEQTIRRLARDRQLPAFKFGGSWRFRREQLEAYGHSGTNAAHASKGIKILLVDDDPGVVRVMREILEGEGHEVLACFNGEKVVETMNGAAPDLIFLDLQMPLYSGPQTLRKILEQWGSVETVVLTAFPDSQLMKEVLDMATVRVMRKPPDLSKILELAARVAQAAR